MWLNEVQVDFKEIEEFGHQLLIRVGEPDTSCSARAFSRRCCGAPRPRLAAGVETGWGMGPQNSITVCCRPATVTSGIGSPGFDVDLYPRRPSLSFLYAPGLPQRFTLYACVSDRCRINQPAP